VARTPRSGVVPASGGSGSGLPSGGAVNQTVLNTAPGTGTWQDVANAMAAGSSHIVITDVSHIATIDLSAADKTALTTLSPHGAVYTWNQTLDTTSNAPITSGWASVQDSDNYGSTLSSAGEFTVPAGLGGYYVIIATFNAHANSTATSATIQQGGSSSYKVPFFLNANSVNNFSVAGVFYLAAGDTVQLQANVGTGTVSFSGTYGLVLTAPSAGGGAGGTGTGLVPIAKTSAYNANANDWVLADTTGGTFAVTIPASPADKTQYALTWSAGGVAPTFTGGTILGSPSLGAIGNTIWIQYSTVAGKYLVV